MAQSKTQSLAETCLGVAIGFVTAVILNAIVMPAYGHTVTWSDNIQMTIIFTVASVIRGYFVRRLFNRFSENS